MYLVTSHLDLPWHEKFPTIARRLADEGLELGTDPIPVVPAAHYMVGGFVWTTSAEPSCAAPTNRCRTSMPLVKWPAPACTEPIAWRRTAY